MNSKFTFTDDLNNLSLPNEEWRDVNGWNRYSVSNMGRIRWSKIVTTKRSKHNGLFMAHILSQQKTIHGYLSVGLKAKGNKRVVKMIHILVADAFIENSMNKRTVNHIDGNKQNNFLKNLEWATHGENHFHAYENGLREHGEKHCAAKVKDLDIPRIFEMRESGMLMREIAEIVGCGRRHVGRILNGKRRVRCVKEYVDVI